MKKQIFNPLLPKGFQYFDESPSVSLQGDNYRTVLGDKGTALLNGADLIAKLAEVVALTPFGNALSATNQATLIIMPGYYDFSLTGISVSQYINLIGISEPEDTRLIGTITITTNAGRYSLTNLSVDNIEKDITESYDNGVWDNLIINTSFSNKQTIYIGKYTKLNCLVDYVLNGALSGAYVEGCTFQRYSCGYYISSSITPVTNQTGIIENCTAVGNSFCYQNVPVNSTYTYTFTFKNCKGGSGCFGYFGVYSVAFSFIINSTYENCVSTSTASFGSLFTNISGSDRGNITFNGKFINCTSSSSSFISRGNASSNSVLTFNGAMEGGIINADTKRNFTSTAKIKNVTHIGNISLIATGANLDKCKVLGTIDNTSAVTPTITRCDFNTLTPYGANVTNLITESEAMNIKNINIT